MINVKFERDFLLSAQCRTLIRSRSAGKTIGVRKNRVVWDMWSVSSFAYE